MSTMSKRFITLTTDWGNKDHYVAVVKSKIYSHVKNDVIIVDITHEIPYFNIFSAAYVLKQAITDFPENTIHIIGVNSEATKESPHVLVQYNNSYFIGADNGVFNILFDKKPEKTIQIDIVQDSHFWGFPSKEVFAKAAVALVNDCNLSELGEETELKLSSFEGFNAYVKNDMLFGKVVHIDHHGNLITNITYEKFTQFTKRKKYVIQVGPYEFNFVNKTYIEVNNGDLVCFFNNSGLLEFAQNTGRFTDIVGLKIKDSIRVCIDA